MEQCEHGYWIGRMLYYKFTTSYISIYQALLDDESREGDLQKDPRLQILFVSLSLLLYTLIIIIIISIITDCNHVITIVACVLLSSLSLY